MKLEEFVAESIRQVVAGVKAAQDPVRECGGIVNPARAYETKEIEFDIAVTTSEGT